MHTDGAPQIPSMPPTNRAHQLFQYRPYPTWRTASPAAPHPPEAARADSAGGASQGGHRDSVSSSETWPFRWDEFSCFGVRLPPRDGTSVRISRKWGHRAKTALNRL